MNLSLSYLRSSAFIGGQVAFFRSLSRLLAEYFGVGFPVGIKAVLFAPLPSGFHFRSGYVPIRAALLQYRSQVLPQLFVGWPAEEPIPIVDFKNQQSRLQHNGVRDHRIVPRIGVLGNVQIL